MIAVTSFIIFSLAAYILLINIHLHSHNFGLNLDKIIVGGMAISGVIGIFLSGCLWRWILLGVGALGGVSLGLVLFSGIKSSSTLLIWIRPVIFGLLAITGAFLLKKFERPLIIFATSIVGALLLTFGLDIFIATGFDLTILSLISTNIDPTKIKFNEKQMLGMILLWIGSTILGIVIQSRFKIKSHTRK